MKKRKIDGSEIGKRIERKKILKQQIPAIAQKLDALRLPFLRMEAGDAKARLNSFMNLNGEDESRIPENRRAEFRSLKENAESKENSAKAAIKQHKELSSELAALKAELVDIDAPKEIRQFSIQGLRDFVLEAVEDGIDRIKSTQEKLTSLEAKTNKLKEELDTLIYQSKTLDEEALLDLSVESHMSELRKMEQLRSRQGAAEDLLEKTELAVEAKKELLQAEKKGFADDLTYAVSAYTKGGIFKVGKELKRILEEDEEYSKAATELCNGLLSETKTDPVHVFGFTGGTLEVQTHPFHLPDLREKVKTMVEGTLNQN